MHLVNENSGQIYGDPVLRIDIYIYIHKFYAQNGEREKKKWELMHLWIIYYLG